MLCKVTVIGMKAFGMTDKGLVRSENQDAYRIVTLSDNSQCCVVCDGMGGHNAGNVASTFAIDGFVEALDAELMAGTDRQHAIEKACRAANELVFDAAARNPLLSGMGTTIVAAVVSEDNIMVANIGDSRAYHIYKGNIYQITYDHSLVAGLIEKGEITPEQAKTHPRRNLITRALGTEETVICDIYEIDPYLGGFIVLCSDGLSNLISDQEIRQLIKGADEVSCKALMDLTFERGATDNVTILIIEL